MSEVGFAVTLVSGFPDDQKRALTELVRYILPQGRFGPIDHQTKSINFDAFYLTSTTATSTGEFSIVHGMGRAPYLMTVVTDLTAVGSGTPVLRVSRAADAQRIYLKADAGSTNLPFSVLVE